jgi:hypothetical protein
MKAIQFLMLIMALILFLTLCLATHITQRLILFWYIFNIFIGYIEAKMFFNQEYMSQKNPKYLENPNFYNKDYSYDELTGKEFVVDGFLEYVKSSGDKRYIETNKGDFVTWLEMLNAIIGSIFGIIIIYGLVTNKINVSNIAILLLIVSSMHLYGTVLYYLSYYTKTYKYVKNKDLKWYIHLVLFNIPWIVVPIILIVYSIRVIHYNKFI